MDQWAVTELQATCSSLGVNDGVSYHPDVDCVECVKDLIRFLRRDDANHEIRRSLGDLGVVKSDLVPILRDHSNDRELFDVTLRLLVNLTNPELLLFKEELPEDKETRNFYLQIQTHRQNYKECFIDQQLWTVLSNTLSALLKKDWDERLEDDKLIIERVLILIRNVLQVPTNVRREGRTEDDATVHDQVLWVLHKSGMQDLLLYIAGSDQEQHYCLHVLEIISLIFREQDPTSLASANLGRSKAEKQADEEALAKAVKLEAEKQKTKIKAKNFNRHSRFGGTYVLKDVKSISERDMIVQKPISAVSEINFDKEKKGVKKAKNRTAPENVDQVRRSTLPVRLFLKEFCSEFLHSAYNHIMNVVKDALNRQKAQMNDETYFLWAMRFFMQFNRGHNMKVELVSETLSRQTFHFLQQQMDNYRDNFEHEKKNRPKYLMWGRRMHLCIRAYQELLHNLVDMEASGNEDIKEAGRVLKASVFYEPEYRELCLQQLSSYNPDKMTLGYLTDLVSTTHVFLKLMEQMSKNKHLIVSKKTKKKAKKSSTKSKSGGVPTSESREENEVVWESISSQLSALLQGRAELPTDVLPFDAASDESMEEQKVTCMKNIQRSLRNREPANALALMRAAREVWPEGDSFGETGAEEEEEFMALREVLFAELGVEYNTGPQPETGEVGEEEDEEDEEEDEEDNVKVLSVEQEFNFKAFVFRFAVKNVTMPYGVLFNNYLNNSKETNHHVMRMFHRIAVECELPALLFQASIFRVFQLIWKDLKSNPSDASLRELAKFGKFIVSKFMKVATENKKVFMELLFWKTSREATEIVEGYGTQTNSAKAKAAFWSSEEEERLSTVFGQVMEMERSGDNSDRQGDILDQIELIFSCEKRSRRQIGNKLRELGLIQNVREITKKPLKSSRAWQEEELDKLQELFEEFKEAENPAARITEQWKAANMPPRSKNKLCEKIVELGWVEDRSKLGKVKKRNRKPKEGEAGFLNSRSDSDSALEDSSSEGESNSDSEEEHSEPTNQVGLREALEKVAGQSKTLLWLAETLKEEAEDREEDFEGEDVPLVTVDQEIQGSLGDGDVMEFLSILGLCSPSQGEQFWRISGNLTAAQLVERSKLLTSVGNGIDIEESFENIDKTLLVVERGFQAIKKTRKKKKEKRGPNKWQPLRRAEMPEPYKKSKTPKRSKKPKNKSFLESSDEEVSKENEKNDNDENVDPENKENIPSKKKDETTNPFDKIKKLNVDRIKKLLDDDSFTGSEGSEEDPDVHDSDTDVQKKKKKTAAKRQTKKKNSESKKKDDELENSSSDEDEEEVGKKKKVKGKKPLKKSSLASSSDEGVLDPTQPSADPIKAAPSGEDSSVSMEKISLDSSSDEGKDTRKKEKSVETSRRAILSSSDEELELPKRHVKINSVLDSDDDNARSRSSSISSLDDSKAKSPTQWVLTPKKGFQLDDSRTSLDDSRLSLDDSRARSPTQWVLTPKKGSQLNDSIRTNSSIDSRTRSPVSSPLSSRTVSPSTPLSKSPLVKSTPANKRLRDTPGLSEKASKRTRVDSPDKADVLEDSPVKASRAKKAVIESDSE